MSKATIHENVESLLKTAKGELEELKAEYERIDAQYKELSAQRESLSGAIRHLDYLASDLASYIKYYDEHTI